MKNDYKNYDLNTTPQNPYSYQEQKVNDSKKQEVQSTNTYTTQTTDVYKSSYDQNTYAKNMYDPQNPDLDNPYFDLSDDQRQVYKRSELSDEKWEYGSNIGQDSRPDIAALIFGVFSIFLACFSIIGFIFGIIAITCAIKSGELQKKRRNGMAIAGIICGSIGIGISIIFFFIFYLN